MVLDQFRVLEDEQIERNMGRMEESFNSEMRSLSSLVHDWAIWDELSSYIETKDPDFEANNLSFSGLESLGISHLALLDHNKIPILSVELDRESETLHVLPEGLKEAILSSEAVGLFLAPSSAGSAPTPQSHFEGLVVWKEKS